MTNGRHDAHLDAPHPPDAVVELAAEEGSAGIARQLVLGLLDDRNVSEERANEIALSVVEACNNAAFHAYPDGPPGILRVSASLRRASLAVTVEDEGQGVRPQAAGDRVGLGLGMPLMVAYSDELAFSGGRGRGLSVRFTFALAGPPA